MAGRDSIVSPCSWLVGHKHDVLTVDYWPPNTLATGSYDGAVLLWNLVSGHNLLRLVPPDLPGAQGKTPQVTPSANPNPQTSIITIYGQHS